MRPRRPTCLMSSAPSPCSTSSPIAIEAHFQMSLPALAPGSADALLFDLGRVVIDVDFNKTLACWAGHAGCKPSLLVERFGRDEAYRRHETGEINDAEFFAALRTSLGISISDAQFLEGWNAIFAGEMPG